MTLFQLLTILDLSQDLTALSTPTEANRCPNVTLPATNFTKHCPPVDTNIKSCSLRWYKNGTNVSEGPLLDLSGKGSEDVYGNYACEFQCSVRKKPCIINLACFSLIKPTSSFVTYRGNFQIIELI